MTHPYDNIDHKLILALRGGTHLSEQALVAHYTKGVNRKMAMDDALARADEITAAAAALRAEIERVEDAESEVA